MPLSELYRMARGKLDSSQVKNPSCSTDLAFVPENDFVELVWGNGQISMQGQSSRARKIPACNSLPSHTPKSRDKDTGNGVTNLKMGKFVAMDSVLSEIPISVPSGEMGLNPDDEVVPWLNYPVDQSLQNEYSDFLPELARLTANQTPTHSNFASFDRRSQPIRDSSTASLNDGAGFEQRNLSKVPSPTLADGEAARPRTDTSQLFMLPSQSQLCQISSPYFRSKILENSLGHASTQHAICGDSVGVQTSDGGLSGIKMQKQDPIPPCNNTVLMNFSHFSRPAALVKASLQNIGSMASIERIGSKEKRSAASISNPYPADTTLIDSNIELHKENISHCQPTTDIKESEAKFRDEAVAAEPTDAICEENVLKNDKNPRQVIAESASKGLLDSDKAIEPVLAASSVCSGNSVERASDDPVHNLKRKNRDNEESECPSEDAEEESVGVKKAVTARGGTGSKRSRAAEVHNLSERRRRDRINEKMRALQELIPNCNKVDKASMLDEAIEYLKTLQLQVQIMSMGAGLYMPPMMLPTGMQHMHAAHMSHFSPMGVGLGMVMGMGFGMPLPDMNIVGSSTCPMVQVPPLPGGPFSGPTALHGMAGSSNQHLFGLPGQGLPMSMPRGPLIPISGGHPMKSAMGACGLVGPMDKTDSATASSSKDPVQNINLQAAQNTNDSSSMNQTSAQCPTTNQSFEQPVAVQENGQASEITGSHVPFRSADGNEKLPDRL